MNEDCFIIATGPSLLNLTDEEKRYINRCNCLSVNRYLCFYDMIGIEPDSNLYVDEDHKTKPILRESIKKFGNKRLKYYTSQLNLQYIHDIGRNHWEIIKLKEYNYQKFAESLDDSLFWCSIIGMAINLAYIIYPNKNVKVVGMDGGLMTHFWCEDMINNSKNYNEDAKQNLDHSTKNNHQVCNWWPNSFKIIQNFFKDKDINVYNCNKNSWFVKNGYMDCNHILK